MNQHKRFQRWSPWFFPAISSFLAAAIFLATRGDLARIEGLDALNLDQVSDKGATVLRAFLITGICLCFPRTRLLQVAAISSAIGMLIYIGVDMRAQLMEFEKMGLVPSPFMDQVTVTAAGVITGIALTLFLLALVTEQIWKPASK